MSHTSHMVSRFLHKTTRVDMRRKSLFYYARGNPLFLFLWSIKKFNFNTAKCQMKRIHSLEGIERIIGIEGNGILNRGLKN